MTTNLTPLTVSAAVFLKVKRLDPLVPLPDYATLGAACVDLHACAPAAVTLYRGETHVFPTGLKLQFPPGYALLIFCRSGLAFKHNVHLANNVAIIDSDFRGEIQLKLVREYTTDSLDSAITIKPYDRIAQAMLVPAPHMYFAEVDELDDSLRGEGGLGSTGTDAQAGDSQQIDPGVKKRADAYMENVRRALQELERDENPATGEAGCSRCPGD